MWKNSLFLCAAPVIVDELKVRRCASARLDHLRKSQTVLALERLRARNALTFKNQLRPRAHDSRQANRGDTPLLASPDEPFCIIRPIGHGRSSNRPIRCDSLNECVRGIRH
jgi:hypothetical protein